ncbi:MAG: hypothetical protein ACFB0Z_03235 [Candidatus Phaeomarinobacter sp.]
MRYEFSVLFRFTIVVSAAALVFSSVISDSAKAQGYPYPVAEIATELGMPQDRFERWWSQAPQAMKSELSGQPLNRWRPTVICDVLGFRIGTPEGGECRETKYKERMASADQWNADGTFKGPSEACLTRNKTDKWGRLICN